MNIDDYVINRVEETSGSDNQPIMTNGYTIFEWDTEVPILNDDEEENEFFDATKQVAYDLYA